MASLDNGPEIVLHHGTLVLCVEGVQPVLHVRLGHLITRGTWFAGCLELYVVPFLSWKKLLEVLTLVDVGEEGFVLKSIQKKVLKGIKLILLLYFLQSFGPFPLILFPVRVSCCLMSV